MKNEEVVNTPATYCGTTTCNICGVCLTTCDMLSSITPPAVDVKVFFWERGQAPPRARKEFDDRIQWCPGDDGVAWHV